MERKEKKLEFSVYNINIIDMKIPKSWQIELVCHEGENRISIKFEKREEWILQVKQFTGARWSAALKCWHILDNRHHRNILGLQELDNIKTKLSNIESLNQKTVQQLRTLIDWMRSKRYSESSIESYLHVLEIFFLHEQPKLPQDITNNDVIDFNSEYILRKKLSATYQSQFVNALKLFFGLVHEKKVQTEQPIVIKQEPIIVKEQIIPIVKEVVIQENQVVEQFKEPIKEHLKPIKEHSVSENETIEFELPISEDNFESDNDDDDDDNDISFDFPDGEEDDDDEIPSTLF
jgi:hypothetical protein